MPSMNQLTVTVRARTRYARLCLWLAARLMPHSQRAGLFVANRAVFWIKVEAGRRPHWQRVTVRVYREAPEE